MSTSQEIEWHIMRYLDLMSLKLELYIFGEAGVQEDEGEMW